MPEQPTAKHLCPYCLKSELAHVTPASRFSYLGTEDLHRLSLRGGIYECSICGMQCTELEVSHAAKHIQPFNPGAGQTDTLRKDLQKEEELLGQAWSLMQKRMWKDALEVLFKQSYPFQLPLEFIFYRDICQIAPMLLGPKSELDTRYQMLNVLLSNIGHLSYYLPADDDEAACKTIKKLYESLLLFGSLPIKRHTNLVFSGPVYYTNHTRAAILSAFADYLEMATIGKKQFTADYLKMAVQLFHKCLELSREKNKLLPYHESRLNLPTHDRQLINTKIKQLNADIKHLDPSFNPAEPLPGPRVYSPAASKTMKYALSIIAYFLTVHLVSYALLSLSPSPISTKDLLYLNGLFHCLILPGAAAYYCSKKNEQVIKQLPLTRTICLYCGQPTMTAPQNTHRSQLDIDINDNTDKFGNVIVMTDHYYKCSTCGVCCSSTDLKLTVNKLRHQQLHDSPAQKEESILDAAWDLIQQQSWEKAQELLYERSHPFRYPMDFMVYRYICQAAPLLLEPSVKYKYPTPGEIALAVTTGYKTTAEVHTLKARYEALDPLLEGLKSLGYHLEDKAPDRVFTSLKRMYSALLFFGSLPIRDCCLNVSRSSVFDYTPSKRLLIFSAFADYLEHRAEKDAQYRAEYVKMAITLLKTGLSFTSIKRKDKKQISLKEISTSFDAERIAAENKIKQLNAEMSQSSISLAPHS